MAALTTEQICDQYSWLYTSLSVPGSTWDHLINVDGAYAGIKRVGDTDYVMFRGSTTFIDWIEDFAHFALPYPDPVLGGVHPGFRLGVIAVKDQIDALVGDKVVCVGHSLGAGHAQLYAGYRLVGSKPVEQIVVFGSPRPGCSILSHLLAPVPLTSYRNTDDEGFDMVTKVPFSVPPMINYMQARGFTDVKSTPNPNDPWLVFKYHHFGLYCKALGSHGIASQSLIDKLSKG